jgi:hypothetical protein
MKSFNQFLTEEEVNKAGKKISTGKSTIKLNPNSEELKEDETCSCDDKKKALRMQELKNKINEAINKRTSKDRIIHDFVHSSDSRFKGASKKDRIKRALGAWYGMHKEDVVNERADFWHPDPAQDRKLGGPGANQRAREDGAAAPKSPSKSDNKLRPGESYMQFAKRKEAERNQKEEFEINEAEGSYGQTPKATAAYGALANKRRNTPASEYPQRGAKKVAVKSAEKHMSRSENPDAGNRGKQSTKPHWTSDTRKGMTQKDRNWRRGADEYGHSGYDGEGGGGSLPKGKKLERQRKTGVSEGMSLKDFKANRKKNERKAASVDAERRGHVDRTWGSGNKYTPDEAKSRRSNMSDLDRSQRYRVANDPDSEHDNYPSDKTKNPKKIRKQTAMGEATRYEKETGKDYKTGKEVTKGGTLGGNDTNAKVMRHMHKSMGAGRMGSNGPIQPRGQKKVPGKKPPSAGEYGSGVKSPAQKLAAKRAAIQQGKDNMSSRFD